MDSSGDSLGTIWYYAVEPSRPVHGGLNAAIRMRLLREHRVCVRDCASFGLPEHVRIGVRRIEDCWRLAGALQEVLEKTDG